MKKLLKMLLVGMLSVFVFMNGDVATANEGSKITKEEKEKLTKKTYVKEQKGIIIKLTYYVDGDRVLIQSAENVIDLEELGATKEQAKKKFDPIVEAYKEVEGITHNIVYTEKQVVEVLELDYQNLDFEKAKNLEGVMLSENFEDARFVSLKESEKLLKEEGFTEE